MPAAAVVITVEAEGVAVGWVQVEGCSNGASPEGLVARLDEVAARRAGDAESTWAVARKAAVRDLLRHGSYKPTGRAKPASEYLLRTAAEGSVPRINILADANNVVSLDSLFPISIVDLARAGADRFVVRWGREGESYVFNPSGQVLELRDLLLAARLPSDLPCATPVKDCQETKTDEATREALAVVYGPVALHEEVGRATRELAELLQTFGNGAVRYGVEGR